MQYDIVIIGAGPAGCACALALRKAGLSVAMLDKAEFPRNKVCGDAIPGRAIKTLKNIDPAFEIAFKQFHKKYATRKTQVCYKKKQVTFNWVREAYTCTRLEFDNFLFSLVKEHTNTAVFTNTQPAAFVAEEPGYSITLKNSPATLRAKILIGADGAHSSVAKQLAGRTLDRRHHVGSVRAYFSNVAGMSDDTTEIYFDKKLLPSYLWVFPLPGNMANVGFGMLSSEIAEKKIDIKQAFYQFINDVPELKVKFKNAVQLGTLDGFGLPLGSGIHTLSGNNFMLAGDAASLIDPISGDGIGNAMLSGKLSAEQAIRCINENNFTATFMQKYDEVLLREIGAELQTHYKAQQTLAKMPWLLDAVFLACGNKRLKKLIQKQL